MTNTAYEKVTARILESLRAGVAPWRKPWRAGAGWPRNLISGRQYRGVNVLALALAGYESPYWLTFRQARALGGHVRKGEQSQVVVFWKRVTKRSENPDTGESETRAFPLLRFYHVFNVAQCEGIPADKLPKPEQDSAPVDPIAAGDAVLAGYRNKPAVSYGHDSASYSPLLDLVAMPARDAFDSAPAFYSTLFHELTHSTGHSSRLARAGITDRNHFGDHQYSQEELVAEIGAAFLLAAAGIDSEEQAEQNAAYLAGWLKALESDSKLIVVAAAQAQRAVDLILGTQFDSDSESEDN